MLLILAALGFFLLSPLTVVTTTRMDKQTDTFSQVKPPSISRFQMPRPSFLVVALSFSRPCPHTSQGPSLNTYIVPVFSDSGLARACVARDGT